MYGLDKSYIVLLDYIKEIFLSFFLFVNFYFKGYFIKNVNIF